MNAFKKATKEKSKLRLALIGASGSGKTYSALAIAQGLGKKIAFIDTEHGSASKYAGLFDFDVVELESFDPRNYIDIIKMAGNANYEVLIIDSLSHAWMGKDGALEMVNNASKRNQSNNSYTAWRDVTPLHNQLVEAIISCKCHIIGTMRAKTEYVLEANEKGKMSPRKIGMAPIQRDGLEYEFDVVGDMNLDNELIISKTRIPFLSGKIIKNPGNELAQQMQGWLNSGIDKPTPVDIEINYLSEPVEETQPFKNKITDLMKEKHIIVESARAMLKERYNVSSRDSMTINQLGDFIVYLQSLETITPNGKG
jgi:hypothetical protein